MELGRATTARQRGRTPCGGAGSVYQASLGPVQAAISGVTTLTVAPAGSLLAVPFAALLTGPRQRRQPRRKAPFLIHGTDGHSSHAPSAASFVNLRKGAKTVQAANP